MKKIFLTLLCIFCLYLPTSTVLAQTETKEPTAITIEKSTETQEEETEENQPQVAETTTEPKYSFSTILLAILAPCLLIVITYFLLRFFKF